MTTPAQMRGGPAAHAMNPQGPAEDMSLPDSSQPPGTILVQVVGINGAKPQQAKVQLKTIFQSIAQGNSENFATKSPDTKGEATFSDLDTALRYNYQIQVTYGGAIYQVAPFRLGKTGHRVIIHVYPTTSDINDAFVGMRGFSYVQLREGFFRFDVMYRVMNLSETTWLAKGVGLSLPDEASAIDVQSRNGDAGFEEKDGKVYLVGTYPPGQKDVQFSFQVKSHNRARETFTMSVPPHLAELRILAEETPDMSLDVPGFEEPQKTEGPEGKKVLITRRVMQPGQDQLKAVSIELAGLPVIGPGRWYAVVIALVIAIGGILVGLQSLGRKGKQDELKKQTSEAKKLLLDEMVLLEKARKQDIIGPRTYEQTRRQILLALARLEQDEPRDKAQLAGKQPASA